MINEKIKKRFLDWWEGKEMDRPMIRLYVEKEKQPDPSDLCDLSCYTTYEDLHSNPAFRVNWVKNVARQFDTCYEAFNYVDLNYGPGSMAAYLGIQPNFMADTVWYNHLRVDALSEIPLPAFNPQAKYFLQHLGQIKQAVKNAEEQFPIAIPDILENFDILSLLRGNEETCFDMMDDEETVKKYLDAIADIYMNYYDAFYDVVKFGKDNKECVYTAFSIWGPDKTAKIQCDFSCMMSTGQFEDFVIPSLKRQTEEIPYTMYHLDGKDAVRHLDAKCKLEKLNAVQWTPGAGQPDAGYEGWYPIYDKVRDSGKSLWLGFGDGTPEEYIEKAKKIVARYGNSGMYFHFPTVKPEQKKLFIEAFGEE